MAKTEFISESKKVSERISSLNPVIASIKEKAAALPKSARYADYIGQLRCMLNIKIVELVLGVSYGQKTKGNGDIKTFVAFDAASANPTELSQISEILTPFLEWEDEYFTQHPELFEIKKDDMSIDEYTITLSHISLDKLEKVNAGSVLEYVEMATNIRIDNANMIEMSVVAEQIRNHRNMIKWIIIGGVSALVLAGGITAICIACHNNKSEDDSEEDEEEELDELETGELEEIDLPDVDEDFSAPVVSSGFMRW